MQERLEAIVRGRVQMVMYRDFAMRKARSLKLVGEVQNLSDGTVRVVAEGSREKLDAYVKKLWSGSILSKVEHVEVTFMKAKGGYISFDITYV
jgi:acylphosphatase